MHELTADLVAFLSAGMSFIAAGRDAELRPRVSRAVGLRPGADRRTFTVFVADQAGAALLAVLAPDAPLAVTACEVATHRTVQLKGVVTAVRPARVDERAAIETQAGGYTGSLAGIGLPLPVVRRLVTWPATAVEVRLDAVFEQTPGPGAGRPMGAS